MEQKLSNLLSTWKKIANQYNISWKSSFLQWDLPDNIEADLALNLALPVSHKVKRSPREVAQEIIKATDCSNLDWVITKQGYINIILPNIYYQELFKSTYQCQGNNLRGEKKNIRINIEYVSTNPTGYLHLAHFRHAFVGNSLANVYQFLGYQITREYYINDRGGQINSLIDSIYYFYQQSQGIIQKNAAKIEYPGQASQEIAQKLIEKWGSKYINEKLNAEEFSIWKKEILNLILAKIRQDLEKCGVRFDIWFSETNLYEKNKHRELVAELETRDLIYSREGATFFRTSLGGDDKDRVIIKQDGEYTYFFSDVLYHQDKLKRTDQLIDILGADHHGYMARIKSACQLLGYKPENIQIILVQMVNLLTKEGYTERFSKRVGNTIELAEVLEYMDINQLKFFLLEKEPNQPLSINVELLKENKEKTRLYYIQYAHARCHQIFRKSQEKNIAKISFNINLLSQAGERKIFKLLVRFPFILENIIEENKPHHLIHYLSELARVWQIYYQNSIILDEENSELTAQKLLLVKNIQIILKLGLDLIGIEAPKKM